MFKMSKQELVVRLDAATKAANEYSNTDNKLLLFAPCGMVCCVNAEIKKVSDCNQDSSILDIALGIDRPATSCTKTDEEVFVLCKDAEITTYSGANFNVPVLCLALKDVFGFSSGTPSR